MRRYHNRLFRFEADKDGGNTGLGGEVLDAFKKLLEKHGNSESAVAQMLYQDNYKLREQLRDLKDKVPAQGTVAVAEADAQLLESYRKLGEPNALTTALTERDQLHSELHGLRRDAAIQEAARVSGYRFGVLKHLAAPDLAFEVKEVEQDGEKIQSVFVAPKDGQPQSLQQYASEHWADFLPALIPQGGGQTPQAGATTGVTFPRQGTGGSGKPKSLVDQFIAEQNKPREGA